MKTQPRAYEDFVRLVMSHYAHPTNRKTLGDTFIHVLRGERPDIASKIEGTLFDPSGKSVINPKITQTVESLWG